MQRRVGFLLLALATCGCDNPNPDLVPVGGHVMLEGTPLQAFVVNFTPIGKTRGSGALGRTDENGHFSLTDVRGQPGAYVGDYKVSFYPTLAGETPRDDPSDVVASANTGLPEIYVNPNRTPLRASVPIAGGSIEIVLTKSGKGATTKTTPSTATEDRSAE